MGRTNRESLKNTEKAGISESGTKEESRQKKNLLSYDSSASSSSESSSEKDSLASSSDLVSERSVESEIVMDWNESDQIPLPTPEKDTPSLIK